MPHADFWAPERHYVDHLAPIWHALDPAVRGTFWTKPGLADHARRHGVPVRLADGTPRDLRSGRWPVVTAAWGQARQLLATGRPVVLVNHGAGQTYNVAHPSYSGGAPELRSRIALFLEPGPHSAEATRASLPGARVVEVGSAKLDRWHVAPPKPRGERPTVAVSFHWRCKVCPETDTALDHFRPALAGLAAEFHLLGHGHPTAWAEIRPMWEELGVEAVADFDEVLARADLYIADNTSTLYEFASTGRPVVCLNAPTYRRDVHHGLRFWDAVPGVQCDHPADLPTAVRAALEDSPDRQAERQHAVRRAYSACDGKAAERAADAVAQLVAETAVETVAISSLLGTVTVGRPTWDLLANGVEIVDGLGYRMLVRRTDFENRWATAGWKVATDDDDA